jgi:hypothetical protein
MSDGGSVEIPFDGPAADAEGDGVADDNVFGRTFNQSSVCEEI